MKAQKVVCTVVLLLVALFASFYAIFSTRTVLIRKLPSALNVRTNAKVHANKPEGTHVTVPKLFHPNKPTRFLFSVQTEDCLPSYLNTDAIIGNTTACQCDVLVLSFKSECTETSPEHIEYTFVSHTSWNTGRNKLFELARKRPKKYLYYIFMDDDVQLDTELEINPWRAFQDFLKEVEPAVGVVDDTLRLNMSYKARKELGCSTENYVPDYFNAPQFDSAFNAFHYQAIDHILPYPTKFDNISWWYSGWYAKIKCDVMFPGQTVMLTKITRSNLQHRNYPQKTPFKRTDWDMIMREIEASLPEKHRNNSIFLEWRKNGKKYEEESITHCFSLPTPHMPIKPFSYLDSQS